MTQIVAKTKQWIENEHSEIEKNIPTELLVQDGKLYLAHDGSILSGQEGQPLIQGEKGEPGEPGSKGDKGDPGASGGVELYQYACTISAVVDSSQFVIFINILSNENITEFTNDKLSSIINSFTGTNENYPCTGFIKDISQGNKVIGLIASISYDSLFKINYYDMTGSGYQNFTTINTTDIQTISFTKYQLLGVTATLATITQDIETGDINIVTPD